MELTVFFPCLNDGPSIGVLARAADAAARKAVRSHEIIVVDDGSTDDSLRILENLSGEMPSLRVIRHGTNKGYGAALRSGFSAARGELVFYTDGDGQYDPSGLAPMLAAMGPEIDWVNGFKVSRQDPGHRILLGEIYRAAVRWAFGLSLRDPHCDFRLIRRSFLERLSLSSDGAAICVELVRGLERLGARRVEIPVEHLPRGHGRSQFFRPRRLAQLAGGLIRLGLAEERS